MSKDNPEVGDVWKNEGKICSIVRKWKLSDGTFAIQYIFCCGDGAFLMDSYRCDYFLKTATYLFKAKCSISDLFEVKE